MPGRISAHDVAEMYVRLVHKETKVEYIHMYNKHIVRQSSAVLFMFICQILQQKHYFYLV